MSSSSSVTFQHVLNAAARATGIGPVRGTDSRFFATTKKGELAELREELNSPKQGVKRDAIKKVIAAMTVGKDVSSLFPDMINSMQTNNLEQKKLVYLFVVNFARSAPDLSMLGVNTWRRDANDPNPLIRALAIRTMGCVRVDKIVEYLCEPLRRALKDDDPYVRKTAALCVAKLYDLDPELCVDQGFVESLRELISDANPAVVANSVAALSEIAEASPNPHEVFSVTAQVLHKLLAALNECSEWGQVFILDALGAYVPHDGAEAESIVERVTPRLQHSNAAVVMGAVKVIVRYVDLIPDQDVRRQLCKKLAPPLVTLISSNAPEIQYVALRNIQLIIASKPDILAKDIKVFFCKFNDPLWVKMEKLEVLIQLVRENTAELVLGELKEYASEVDVEFVRRSVRAIGRTAIKLERTSERCVNVLIDLIQTRVNYVVQEAVVTIRDIFRRYPNRYESVISVLCENLESLDEPAAKASMVWIVGENADRIDNATELLETFVDSFFDEVAEVQLQLLTAVVKLFLVRPTARALMERVLRLCTEESDNPDLRDRAFIYWRLLFTDPEAARRVVMGEKPVIEDDSAKIDDALLTELIDSFSTLASVYHKPARSFVKRVVRQAPSSLEADVTQTTTTGEAGAAAEEDENGEEVPSDLLDLGGGGGNSSPAVNPFSVPSAKGQAPPRPQLPVLLDANDAKAAGLGVRGTFQRENAIIYLVLELSSSSADLGEKFAIKFNKNTFALAPKKAAFVTVDGPVRGSTSRSARVEIGMDPNNANPGIAPNLNVEMALKISATAAVVYFSCRIPFHVLFVETPKTVANPAAAWTAAADSTALVETSISGGYDPVAVASVLREHRVMPLTNEFFSLATSTGANCLVRLSPPMIQVRSTQRQVLPFVLEGIQELVALAAPPTVSTTTVPDDLFGGGFGATTATTSSAAANPASGSGDLLGLF